MLEDEKFSGYSVVYYNAGKSGADLKNSLCQDFIVFNRDFIILLWLLQALNYYGNYRLLECVK